MPNKNKFSLFPGLIIQFLISSITQNSSSFHSDSIAIVKNMGVPLKIQGREFIPQAGPGLVVFNHYSREGFSILFAAAAIAAAVPVDMHWIMTGAWTFPGRLFSNKLRKDSEKVFRAIARTYGFTLTPPLPPDPADQPARTAAIREVFTNIKADPNTLVAFAPEGRDFPGGVLGMPPGGSGKFLLELSRRLGLVYPVGIFEEGGGLHLYFGAPFDLCSIIRESRLDPDSASRVVMERIASLLPGYLAGEFEASLAAFPEDRSA
jgi:1-acyl-sn-glycerol-3-phosphate acyltransferase